MKLAGRSFSCGEIGLGVGGPPGDCRDINMSTRQPLLNLTPLLCVHSSRHGVAVMSWIMLLRYTPDVHCMRVHALIREPINVSSTRADGATVLHRVDVLTQRVLGCAIRTSKLCDDQQSK